MKNYFRTHAAPVLALVLIGSLIACRKEKEKPPVKKIPAIAMFTPAAGPAGTEVTINGVSFGSNPKVKFNGTEAAVISSTDKEIVTKVPVGATTGKIVVIVDTLTATSINDYTVTQPVSDWNLATFAGSGENGASNGQGTAATFRGPAGMATDKDGNIYLADVLSHQIRKITPSGTVSTFAGRGMTGANNGPAAEAGFRAPYAVAVDAQGNVYVADRDNHLVRKISNGVVSTLAGTGSQGSTDGANNKATFNAPSGITADAQGNVFVSDYGNNKIRKIEPDGTVSTFAGNGTNNSTDGNGTAAAIAKPVGIQVTADGTLYVIEAETGKIRRIGSNRQVQTVPGNLGTTVKPLFFAADNEGNFYVAAQMDHKIRKINADGGISDVAGTGEAGSTDGTSGKFNKPTGIALFRDAQGKTTIYVSESDNRKVRKLTRN